MSNEQQQPFVPRTPMDFQKLKLDRLMQNPNKPVVIPESPREKKGFAVPEFVRNVMGSSAGAGSGEFHVYRHLRRKEYTRQKMIEEKGEKEKLDEAYQFKLEENKRKMEEKTAKNRAKRLKRKQKLKNKAKTKGQTKVVDDETESESDPEDDLENNDSSNYKGFQGDEKDDIGSDCPKDESAAEQCEISIENNLDTVQNDESAADQFKVGIENNPDTVQNDESAAEQFEVTTENYSDTVQNDDK